MAKIISIFDNEVGVGKTIYMYHVAHLLARNGLNVLMVDRDPSRILPLTLCRME